ncbi:glycosyltransferase [Ligilactobacillus sp. Marseille-Q7487]|uniref:glycosyltransferase n=1 Tax=Ligilactobacillus sp. Marseille-Q7487 TaxID=3022128 RepID=UPI0024A96855|nr:glycosyltransferase [Ligilactobacillus sp. Marseille-Q7487]
MPEITVILPLYSESLDYAKKAIDSILLQEFVDFELLLILDNPQNYELLNLIKNYKHKDCRVRYMINCKNLGLAATLNRAISEINSKYIARMDADDISKKDRLIKQYNYMTNNREIGICGTAVEYIDKNGNFILEDNILPQNIEKSLKYKNCMNHPTYFAQTIVMKKIKYREDLKYAQDYDFVCRCVENGIKIANMNEKLLFYRLERNSPRKQVYQNITAYYIKKFYRKGNLSIQKNLGNIIQNDINKYGEENLIELASMRNFIKDLVSSHNIKNIFKKIKMLFYVHPYRFDQLKSNILFKVMKIGDFL